jgi:Domain of unknown function (DUF4397)
MGSPLSHRVPRLLGFVTVALALVLALLPLSGLSTRAQQETAEAKATLRVIHASPGAPEVDVLVDGQPVLQRLAYGSTSDYLPISAEGHRVQIVPTGQTANAAVVDEEIDAAPGQAYIVAVFGLLNDIGGDVYEVDMSEIEPGNARVRVINLSPDAGDIDLVETGGDAWFNDVGLGEASDYTNIAPGTYSADLRGDDDRTLKTFPDVTFEETRVYDLVVLGQLADDSLELQSLVTSVSPPCAEVLKLEGSGSDACVRFIHAAPDATAVDIYLNDAKVSAGLAYGTATEYAAVPSGQGRGVRVTAQDAPVEEAMIDTSLDFQAGQAYEILVSGAGDDLELTITGTDLRPVPAGQARLRLIHAGPDAGSVDLGVADSEQNLFDGVNFRDATHYAVVDMGDYQLQVRPGGDDTTVALQTDLTVEEGVVYDLILIGRPDDRSLKLLALTVPVAIQTGEVATPEAAASETTVAGTVVPAETANLELTPTATPAG